MRFTHYTVNICFSTCNISGCLGNICRYRGEPSLYIKRQTIQPPGESRSALPSYRPLVSEQIDRNESRHLPWLFRRDACSNPFVEPACQAQCRLLHMRGCSEVSKLNILRVLQGIVVELTLYRDIVDSRERRQVDTYPIDCVSCLRHLTTSPA